MVEHIGDYEQYTTIYQMKREFDEQNALIWKLKKQIEKLKQRNYIGAFLIPRFIVLKSAFK